MKIMRGGGESSFCMSVDCGYGFTREFNSIDFFKKKGLVSCGCAEFTFKNNFRIRSFEKKMEFDLPVHDNSIFISNYIFKKQIQIYFSFF